MAGAGGFAVTVLWVAGVAIWPGANPTMADEPVKAQEPDETGPPWADRVELQIGEFVRRIFLDKAGHLWFGTNSYGLCRFDGKQLTRIRPEDGLAGHQTTGIIQDRNGHLWFATNGGVSRYDGKTFTNYGKADGLTDPYAWTIMEDRKGTIWVGTLGGAYRFDGKKFARFDIPAAKEIDETRGIQSTKLIAHIMEDRKGNLWFATAGAGIYRYDGKTLTNLSTKDGLSNNFVNCIVEDRRGDIWIATHHGGVCRYDGKTVTRIAEKDGVRGVEAWSIYEDRHGHIWFTLEGTGIYRYDGKSYTHFGEQQGVPHAIQCFGEDGKGRMLVGGYGGLFRQAGTKFINVTESGPWD
jgi:ligand-binding sensor domain-containing protein